MKNLQIEIEMNKRHWQNAETSKPLKFEIKNTGYDILKEANR